MSASQKPEEMSNNNNAVVSTSVRDVQPAHYLFKIESFSILSEEDIEKYDSDDFEAGGYKWGLCFYPNGNKKGNGHGHISLYLVMKDVNSFPRGWVVSVQFKFFVYDHIWDNYLTIQDADGEPRRFHQMKTEWGFSQLLSLDTFRNTSNGYLFDDSCVFGVEVFVIKYAGRGECLSMIKNPEDNIYTWKVHNFSAINVNSLYSKQFEVQGQKWYVLLYPKGNLKGKDNSLSLYLSVADCATLPGNWKFYAKFKLRVMDQVQGEHYEVEVSNWFTASTKDCGISKFMLLSDLNDVSKGFIVKDTLIVEAEIMVISVLKYF